MRSGLAFTAALVSLVSLFAGACAVGSDQPGADDAGADALDLAAEAGPDARRPIAAGDAAGDATITPPEPPPPPPSDAEVDAESDSGTDGGTDAGLDTGTDAALDTGADGAADTGADAALDGGADGAADTGTDAAPDSGADAGTDAAPPPQTVMVVRVGDRAGALSSASTALFLEERAVADGALARTIALPTAASGANHAFTVSGTASSEGALATSADGRYVTLAGYATAPGTAGVSATTATAVRRAVARVDAAGNVDTSTLLGDGFSGDNARGAVTVDGTAFWASGNGTGANGGLLYATLGSSAAPVQVLAAPSNTRVAGLFFGQLYTTSGTASFDGVASVGAGQPVTTGQTATLLTAAGGSPYAFAVLDLSAAVPGVDTIYVADDRSPATGGGVQKWTSNGATWSLAATFASGLPTVGVRGLVALASPPRVRIVATTAESPSRLVTYLDDGTASPPLTVLATAAASTAYRGVALSPTN